MRQTIATFWLISAVVVAQMVVFVPPESTNAQAGAGSSHDFGPPQSTEETPRTTDTGRHPVFTEDSEEVVVPCEYVRSPGGKGYVGMYVPQEICDSYHNGYAKGLKVPQHYNHINICLDKHGPNPEATDYRISDIEYFSPGVTDGLVAALQIYGRFPTKTDHILNLKGAIGDYNGQISPNILYIEPTHETFKVPTIEDYRIRGGLNGYRLWDYSLYQGNGIQPPPRPQPNNFDFWVRPAKLDWEAPILAWWKSKEWWWEWKYRVTGYDEIRQWQCDPLTGCSYQLVGYTTPMSTTYDDSQYEIRWTRKRSVTGFPEGEPPSVYDQELERLVRLDPYPPEPSASPDYHCPYDHCTGFTILETTIPPPKENEPERTDDGYLTEAPPVFWQIHQQWGDHIKPTERPGSRAVLTKLKTGWDGDTGPGGVGWIDLGREYSIHYYWCYTTRNGGWITGWQSAVPFPRQTATHTPLGFKDRSVLTAPLEKPWPQSVSGMHSDNPAGIAPRPQSSPSVHIPVPIFDKGSNVGHDQIGPDGNWWAVLRTTPPPTTDAITGDLNFDDCVNYGGIPVCTAVAYRPWRAVWYIEPPPDDLRAGADPAPREVRLCAYSDSDTSSLLADASREPATVPSGTPNSPSPPYQVNVDLSVPTRSMMHTLHDLNKLYAGDDSSHSVLTDWLMDWLYGTGPNLARAYGQDQVDPDRYCWYKWWQAQNDEDGYRGIVAVEWLATVYLGVPYDPFTYCLGNSGVHPGALYDAVWDPPHSDTYDCSTNLDAKSDAGYRWFRLAAGDWNHPSPDSPSFTLDYFDHPVDKIYQCHVGTQALTNMGGEEFTWFLQGAAILYDNHQGPTNEPWHPLAPHPTVSNNPPLTGRMPATTSGPVAGWWKPTSSAHVATPQNASIVLTETDPDRRYVAGTMPLQYPSRLDKTTGHDDCGNVPLWRIGIPCVQHDTFGRCSKEKYFGLFGSTTTVDNKGTLDPSDDVVTVNDVPGQLWAWWGQGIGEVRFSTFPIPVDPDSP